MVRRPFPGGWYADALPSGEFAVLFPQTVAADGTVTAAGRMETHLGVWPLPLNDEPLYHRITAVGGFRVAGQAHYSLSTWEGSPGTWTRLGPSCGVSPVIYDRLGTLHLSDCSIGSQGWRYVADDGTPAGRLVTGDETYGSAAYGLNEFTDLGDGLIVGQGNPDLGAPCGGALVWDGRVHRVIEPGDCRFIRATREGNAVSIAMWKPGFGAVIFWLTVDELRGRERGPVNTDDDDPPPPPRPLRPHAKGLTMDIDGKIVVLRGPGGLLLMPDAPNTGTWGGLGRGWRGAIWTADGATQLRAKKLPNGRYTFTSVAHQGLVGADAGQYSPALDQQIYFKPDGDPDAGDLEQWRVYDGNENGAIEAQIEQVTDAQHPAGAGKKFFAYPLAVEVVVS